jgi:excisionase family DNA binding protein
MFFENRLLNYKQAATYLGISISYLRELKANREVSHVCIGARAIRFRVSALDSFVKKREVSK